MVKKATVRGLTTAATIWVIAGIGLIVGVGMYAVAIMSTLLVLLSLIVLNKFEQRFMNKPLLSIVHITLDKDQGFPPEAAAIFNKHNITINHLELISDKENRCMHYKLEIPHLDSEAKLTLLQELSILEPVQKISF